MRHSSFIRLAAPKTSGLYPAGLSPASIRTELFLRLILRVDEKSDFNSHRLPPDLSDLLDLTDFLDFRLSTFDGSSQIR